MRKKTNFLKVVLKNKKFLQKTTFSLSNRQPAEKIGIRITKLMNFFFFLIK